MKEGLSTDISNIYWDQRLGPWSDLREAADQSKQRLTQQGVGEEDIHALVQKHEDLLVSAMEEAGPRQP